MTGFRGEEGGCEHCGYADCSGVQEWLADPFLAEIEEQIEMCWLCPGQYSDLSDEI